MSKPKLLWWGDAVAPTGFARVTHSVLERLTSRWEIGVLGINHVGDPHHYPYPIWPARVGDTSPYGVDRAALLVKDFQPDVVLINNDPWNVSQFLKVLPPETPVVAYMPVDGRNCFYGRHLNALAAAILYTQFGADEITKSGYTGPLSVIPHGIDLATFRPSADRRALREQLGLQQRFGDLFIVGNVNRNQPRKRQDLTIAYFADWWKQAGMPAHARLYFHYAGRDGWNLVQLARFYGVHDQLMQSFDNAGAGFQHVSDEDLAVAYNLFDVQVSTTQGEGWGMTSHEGMACGVPQILPDWSAFGEWARDGAILIPCTSTAVTTQGVNVVGGIADRAAFVAALDLLYTTPSLRALWGERARKCASKPEYNWDSIGESFHDVLSRVVEQARITKGEDA